MQQPNHTATAAAAAAASAAAATAAALVSPQAQHESADEHVGRSCVGAIHDDGGTCGHISPGDMVRLSLPANRRARHDGGGQRRPRDATVFALRLSGARLGHASARAKAKRRFTTRERCAFTDAHGRSVGRRLKSEQAQAGAPN